jgi:hypothetical protein
MEVSVVNVELPTKCNIAGAGMRTCSVNQELQLAQCEVSTQLWPYDKYLGIHLIEKFQQVPEVTSTLLVRSYTAE